MCRVGHIQTNEQEDLSTRTFQLSGDSFKLKNFYEKSATASSKIHSEMKNMADRIFSDDSILSQAKRVYRTVVRKDPNFTKGKSHDVIIATCLFMGMMIVESVFSYIWIIF